MNITEKQIKGKKQSKTKAKSKNKKKKNKNKREMKLIAPGPLSFHLERNINQLCDQLGRHFFTNFSLLEIVNSFSSSLIFLIVIFKLSKFDCLVFLAL